jgi:hypothetical protein
VNQLTLSMWKWLVLLSRPVMIGFVWIGLVYAGRIEPVTAVDSEQPRLDRAADVPRDPVTVAQTFIARHNGLSAIELLAVTYPGPPGVSALTLRLKDDAGGPVAEQTFKDLAHNAPLRLAFEPVATSAGQRFTLELLGGLENNSTVWAYSLDGYPDGEQRGSDGDLRFSTTYTYLPTDLVTDIVTSVSELAQWAPVAWVVLFAPGLLMLAVLRMTFATVWSRWGMALALSVSVLAFLWLWASVFNFRLTGVAMQSAYGIVGFVVVVQTLRTWLSDATARPRPGPHDIAMGALLLGAVVVRFLAARDLAFPMWVDSPHHALIARVLAEAGHVPSAYQPVLPVDKFTYHFGFHALAVTFASLTSLTLVATFLFLGNCLNGLMALAAYTLAIELTGRPRAGLIAALIVGLVALFPGYYLAWGRYTQLLGLLIFAPLLGVTWRLIRPSEATLNPGQLAIVVSLLASGLLFAHYRVAFFFATFVWTALAAGRVRGWRSMATVVLLTTLLSAPWLKQLSATWLRPSLANPDFISAPAGYNDFPWGYFDSSLERAWVIAALIGLALMLIARQRTGWLLLGWLALTSALLNLGPGSWVVNNNSWAISLFLPGAVLVGFGGDAVWHWSARLMDAANWLRRGTGLLLQWLLLAALTVVAATGTRAQLTMANPATTLALAADQPALDWVAANTSSDAIFAANSWLWQNNTWAGSDGGAWLTPLTNRRSTIPPVDYAYDARLSESTNAFNERLAAVTEADAPATLDLWREAGVTHIFIGARGGVLKPEMFVDSPNYRLLFTNGAAWVFEVVAP